MPLILKGIKRRLNKIQMGTSTGRGLLTMKTEKSYLTVEAELLSVSYVRAISDSKFYFCRFEMSSIKIFQLIGIQYFVKLLR